MQKYEIMAIVANDLKEADAEKYAADEISALVKKTGGTMTFEDFWGTRGFAYMINKQKWGYYFVGQFEIEPLKVIELKHEWNLAKKIVRFLITKVDPKSPEVTKYADVKKAVVAEEKEKKITETEADSKKSVKPKTVSEPVKKEVEPKKDAIDKKLGEILEDSSLDL